MRDYKGLRFQKLVMLSDVGPGGGSKGRLWLARCDCGNVVKVVAKDAAAGRVRSCTKCPKSLGKGAKPRGGYRARTAEEAKLYRLLIRTAKEAVRKDVPFALSTKDLAQLPLRNCQVCGEECRTHTLALRFVNRVEGYTLTNTRVLCPECRHHMGSSNLADYLEYLARVYRHLAPSTK